MLPSFAFSTLSKTTYNHAAHSRVIVLASVYLFALKESVIQRSGREPVPAKKVFAIMELGSRTLMRLGITESQIVCHASS